MASPYPVDRYHRYKRGTEKAVTYLVDTARKVQQRAGATLEVKGLLSTDRLLQFAHIIRDAKRVVKIPAEILLVFEDVISGRAECAQAFDNLAEESDAQEDDPLVRSNKRHRYFIDILQQIYDLFRKIAGAGKAGPRSKAKAAKQPAPQSAASLANVFESLELMEPETIPDTLLSHETQAQPAPATDSAKTTAYTLDTEEEDKVLQLWCLLQDMADIRAFVQETWRKHFDGEISQLVALQITETATRMKLELSDTFQRAHDDLSCAEYVYIHLNVAAVQGWKGAYATANSGTEDGAKAADLLCVSAYSKLSWIRAEMLRLCYDGAIPDGLVPSSPRPKCQLTNDMIKTLPAVASLIKRLGPDAISAEKYQGLHIEPFLRSLMMFEVPSPIYLWQMSTFAMYEGIWEAGGMDGTRCFAEGPKIAELLLQNIRSYVGPKPVVKMTSISLIEQQESSQAFESCFARLTESAGEELALLRSIPLLAIYNLQHPLRAYHSAGVAVANRRLVVLTVAYLYKASLDAGLVTGEWVDMDFVISEQKRNGSTLVKESKNGLPGWARHLSLDLGVKLVAVSNAANSKPILPTSLKHLLNLAKQIHISSRVTKAYSIVGTRYAEQTKSQLRQDNTIFWTGMYQLAHMCGDGKSGSKNKNVLRTHIELLSAERQILTEDELGTLFDYYGFTQRCEILLKEIGSEFGQTLAKSPAYGGPMCHYEIVHEVLWEAASTPKAKREKTMLYRLAPLLQSVLDKKGDEILQKARPLSSGHISAPHRPCDRWVWGPQDGKPPPPPELIELENRANAVTMTAWSYYRKHLQNAKNLDDEEKLERLRTHLNAEFLAKRIPRTINSIHLTPPRKFQFKAANPTIWPGVMEDETTSVILTGFERPKSIYLGPHNRALNLQKVSTALTNAAKLLGVQLCLGNDASRDQLFGTPSADQFDVPTEAKYQRDVSLLASLWEYLQTHLLPQLPSPPYPEELPKYNFIDMGMGTQLRFLGEDEEFEGFRERVGGCLPGGGGAEMPALLPGSVAPPATAPRLAIRERAGNEPSATLQECGDHVLGGEVSSKTRKKIAAALAEL